MLTGKELGEAIGSAIKKKGVRRAAVARHFNVTPPSVQDWINRGTIRKDKLPELWRYFSDVVGPEHWGMAPEQGGYAATSSKSDLEIDESPDICRDNLSIMPMMPVSLRAAVERLAEQLAELPPKHRRAIGAFLDQLAETPNNKHLIDQILTAMAPPTDQTATEPVTARSSSN